MSGQELLSGRSAVTFGRPVSSWYRLDLFNPNPTPKAYPEAHSRARGQQLFLRSRHFKTVIRALQHVTSQHITEQHSLLMLLQL
eukprot:1140377-Pelagomonas_calceolata.AAC.7